MNKEEVIENLIKFARAHGESCVVRLGKDNDNNKLYDILAKTKSSLENILDLLDGWVSIWWNFKDEYYKNVDSNEWEHFAQENNDEVKKTILENMQYVFGKEMLKISIYGNN